VLLVVPVPPFVELTGPVMLVLTPLVVAAPPLSTVSEPGQSRLLDGIVASPGNPSLGAAKRRAARFLRARLRKLTYLTESLGYFSFAFCAANRENAAS